MVADLRIYSADIGVGCSYLMENLWVLFPLLKIDIMRFRRKSLVFRLVGKQLIFEFSDKFQVKKTRLMLSFEIIGAG